VAYHVEFTSKAADELRHLPKPVQNRVARWIALLADDPRRIGTKQLEGHPGLRRVHASKDYVIVYAVHEGRLLVLVVRLSHRKEAYRGL
jgi:mRNA interferase RelE/StbE